MTTVLYRHFRERGVEYAYNGNTCIISSVITVMHECHADRTRAVSWIAKPSRVVRVMEGGSMHKKC